MPCVRLSAAYGAVLVSKWEGCGCVEFPSCRLVLTLLAFFGFLNIYCLRVNLSVALVCMVNMTAVEHLNLSEGALDNCGNVISEKEKKEEKVTVNYTVVVVIIN